MLNSKFMKLIKLSNISNNTSMSRVPSMGITSLMLRELKKKQQTTIGIVPITCLIAAPHIFPPSTPSTASSSSTSPAEAYDNDSTPLASPQQQQQPSTYDRLSRNGAPSQYQPLPPPPPFLGDDATPLSNASKKPTNSRPIVKSLSSLAPLATDTVATTTAATAPQAHPKQSPSNCRISIYSARKINMMFQKPQPYESFSETVF